MNKILKKSNHFSLLDYPNYDGYPTEINRFLINDPGSCIPENQYGISIGKPCVLIKMNKVEKYK